MERVTPAGIRLALREIGEADLPVLEHLIPVRPQRVDSVLRVLGDPLLRGLDEVVGFVEAGEAEVRPRLGLRDGGAPSVLMVLRPVFLQRVEGAVLGDAGRACNFLPYTQA